MTQLEAIAEAWVYPLAGAPPMGRLAEAKRLVEELAPSLASGALLVGDVLRLAHRELGSRQAGAFKRLQLKEVGK